MAGLFCLNYYFKNYRQTPEFHRLTHQKHLKLYFSNNNLTNSTILLIFFKNFSKKITLKNAFFETKTHFYHFANKTIGQILANPDFCIYKIHNFATVKSLE